ncbi:hypothetical protein PMIN02_011844 [Paraphaeosphaeria minitans]
MARSSFASPGVIPTSLERQYQATERFHVLQASKGISLQTRLLQQKRRFSIRDSEAFVSTAIAPNGRVAVATPSEVRLYNIECQNLNKDVTPTASVRLKLLSKGESVRAVAISDDLLAVVTHRRLMVYEYQETGNIEDNSLPEVRIDQKASWTPRSLSILQVDATDPDQSAAAWIAVGGEGVNGPHRGDITGVNIFESPSERPYIFVAINQEHGSQLMRSFIAPLGAPVSRWRSLPGNTTGRQSLSAAATRNGRFLVVVEDGALKLLTLRGAFGGGLTCSDRTVEWASSLKETAKDMCAISLSVKESLGCIEITGVDGRGHVFSARASVPGMPVTAPPSLTIGGFTMAELHGDQVVPTVPELCGKEISQAPRVDSTVRASSGGVEVMLGR